MLPLWEGTCSSWADDDLWVEDNSVDRSNCDFYDVLADEEEEDEGEEVSVSEDVCLYPSVWERWTRGPEEVCLFPSVWCEWTRTQPRKHGRVRGSGGRRTTTRKNKKRRCPRRRQERRRRRALRRKQLARRARVGGCRRRPPASFRGGGDPLEGDQVCCTLRCRVAFTGPAKFLLLWMRSHEPRSSPLTIPTQPSLRALQVTGEETGQAMEVVEQETGQGPVVSGAQADPAPPLGKRVRNPPFRGLRPAHLASTLLHKHPEISGEVRETSVGAILVNAGSGGDGSGRGGAGPVRGGGGRGRGGAGRGRGGGGRGSGGGAGRGKRPRCPAGGGKRPTDGDKRPRCPAGGGCLGGAGGSGGGDTDGEGGITDIGGDSDGEWSAGGNDGADGGGGPSSSGGSDADGEGDISSDGNSGGSGSDGGGSSGINNAAEKSSAAKNKTKRSVVGGQFAPLAQPRPASEEKDGALAADSLAEAAKLEEAIPTCKKDVRGLTLNDAEIAIEEFSLSGTLPKETLLKMVTDDPRLDGIAAGKDGTEIESPKKGKGTVLASKVVKGHRVFTIKWGRKGTACSEHDTFDVLKWAVEGQAASFEAVVKRIVNNLCIIVCVSGSLVPTFMQNDGKRKLKRELSKLTGKRLARAKKVRPLAWDRMKGLTADETVSPESLALLKGDITLAEALRETPIHELLGFDDAADGMNDGKTWLMEDLTMGYCPQQQHGFVDDIVKYLQAACRLGRLPTLESIGFMMTPLELDGMGVSVLAKEELCASFRVEEGEEKRYGLATRALLARARGDGAFCRWRVHFPLYRLLMLTRPEGKLMETSEHSCKVAKTRKGLSFLEYLKDRSSKTDAWRRDRELHASVHKTYCYQVADDKKADSNRRENAEKRIADNRKVRVERVVALCSPLSKWQSLK